MICRLCGFESTDSLLLEMKGMPSGAQHYPAPDEFSIDRGINLRFCRCPVCDLHQLDNAPVSYFKDVIRSTGYTRSLLDYLKIQLKTLVDLYGLSGEKIIECGCGRGEILKVLKDLPVEGFGVENNVESVAHARSLGLEVQVGFLEDEKSRLEGGPFKGFFSFNFLEHQPNPNGMLRAISSNLTEGGVGFITVPSLEYILSNEAYYELIVDHLLYFSRDTFRAILEKNGFHVDRIDGTLEDTHCAFVRKQAGIAPTLLRSSMERINAELSAFVAKHSQPSAKIIVWGASHQSFTILSSSGILGSISYIVDSAPFKQGRYSPVSHCAIKSPEVLAGEAVSAIIIIAPPYADEIRQIIRSKYSISCPLAIVRKGRVEIA
jgi:SAM-dependent methyltransferase